MHQRTRQCGDSLNLAGQPPTRRSPRRRVAARLAAIWLLALPVLSACGLLESDDEPIPTIARLETLPTAVFLTENAPPPGFGQLVADPVHTNLDARQGWQYTVTGDFSGTFDDDSTPATGSFEALVQANELGETRRVVLDVAGPALLPDGTPIQLEGVRISNDYYLVNVNGDCEAGASGAAVADLTAGQLIGGVRRAVPTGHRRELQGVPTWQYTFAPEDVVLPPTTVKLAANSAVDIGADLWAAPDLNAVVQFELMLELSGVRLLSAERAVSGTLYLRYDLAVDQLDVQPNISIPHGC